MIEESTEPAAVDLPSEFDMLEQMIGVLEKTTADSAAAEPPAPELPDELQPIVFSLLRIGFDTLAPAWAVSDDECNALSSAYMPVLNHYFPDDWKNNIWVAPALVTLAVIGPRARLPRHHPAEPQEGEQ